MAKKRKGIIKLIYFIALFLLGILIWGFFQGKTADTAKKSLNIDNELSDSFLKLGFTNEDIVSQSRDEKKQGASAWVEYYREMNLPPNVDLKLVEKKAGLIAKKYNCSFRAAKGGSDSWDVIEIFEGKKLFSKLVLDIPAGQEFNGTKKLAIVIDDCGYSKDLSRFLSLGIPITFAILPNERNSKALSIQLSKKKMPYILHLPLEPEAYPKIDPGKAAIFVNMSDSEIKSKFLSDLASVPGVTGVNNHMGSRFSANRDKMVVLLKLIKEQNLFFFDSATSTATKGAIAAREVGIQFAENAVFLDNADEKEAIKKQLQYALKKAIKRGRIAVIGHISRKYLPEAIKESIPDFKKNGVEFVYLTDIVSQAK